MMISSCPASHLGSPRRILAGSVQHEHPVVPLATRRRVEFVSARVGDLADVAPGSRCAGRTSGLSLSQGRGRPYGRGRTGLWASSRSRSSRPRPGRRRAGTGLFRAPRPGATGPGRPCTTGIVRRVRHHLHLAGGGVVHRRAPVLESILGKRPVSRLEEPEEVERSIAWPDAPARIAA